MKINTLKGFLIVMLFTMISLPSKNIKASHLQGIDLTYECINNCTIRVYLRAYRDCRGSNFITNTVDFNPQAPCTASGPNPISPWSPQQTTEVTPVCASTPTRCTQSSAPIGGVEEFFWFRDYDICSTPNCIYTLSWTTCCRNPAITSIANPGSQSMYIGSTTLNTGLTQCNSSPQFNNPPVPYLCAGQPFTFNQGAYDPDGDSLSYAFGPCFTTGVGSQVPYATGYSGLTPLGPTWNVTMNPSTGDITITPNPSGSQVVGVICVYVTEWRNGQQINVVVRDIQVTVIPCPSNTVPTLDTLSASYGVSNGSISSNDPVEITLCAGSPVELTLPFYDPNSGQTNTVYWNQTIPGAQFYQQGAPNIQDTIRGNSPTAIFSWTPTVQGTYSFLVTVTDDACPIVGQKQFTVVLNVRRGLQGASAMATPIGCTNVAFSASPGTSGIPPYTYYWTGAGNLDLNAQNTTQSFNHTYPGPGTYPYTCIITDSFGCQETIQDTVIVLTGPTADAGPDITVCSGVPIQLGFAGQPGTTYSWNGPVGLSATNVPNPTLTHNVSGATADTLNYVFTAVQGLCTAIDYVTIIVTPIPSGTVSGNLQPCAGDSTDLIATGGSRYIWSTGDTTSTIRVAPLVPTTYTVSPVSAGCVGAPVQVTVNPIPLPVPVISGTQEVCPGGIATLTVVGGISWTWSTGSTGQTITLLNLQQDTTVSVVASNGQCTGLPALFTVSVKEAPVANFSNTTECFGSATSFADQSTAPANNTVSTWEWNFDDPVSGNNNFSVAQNPTHLFTAPGTYDVRLIITSTNGCRDTMTRQVVVNPNPGVDFTFNDGCTLDAIDFTATATTTVQTWIWDFGDGQTLTAVDPVHYYTAPGYYNVTLNVTDVNGCTGSVVKTVRIHAIPEPDFTYVNSCFNTITEFTSTSSFGNNPTGSTIDAWAWDFGDPSSGQDNTSTLENPIHSYSDPGNYTVTLTITSSQGCENTITRTITVEPYPAPQMNEGAECRGESVELSVSQIPVGAIVEWYYSLNDPIPFYRGTSWETPPLLTTTLYYIRLYNEVDGCRTPYYPIRATINQPPSVSVIPSETELELPNAITTFYLDDNSPNPIAGYLWDFGDGTTSEQASPAHQYDLPGLYDVLLTVIDVNGCSTSYIFGELINVIENFGLYLPTAFSPNGDGYNDEYYVGARLMQDFAMEVYDRWGRTVFATNALEFTWDGRDNDLQPLPEGVYSYSVVAHTYSGKVVERRGSITIIR